MNRCTDDVIEKLVQLSSLDDLELLLVVQGGNPLLSEQHQKWLGSCDNVRVIVNTKVGVNFSRNESLRRSHSKYVAFLDDDIDPNQQFFSRALEKISTIDATDIVLVCNLDFSSGGPKSFSQGQHVYDIATAVGAPNLILPTSFMKENAIHFEESIGAGRSVAFGDEFLVVCCALKSGASILILEDSIGVHHGRSSIERLSKFQRVIGLGGLIYRLGAREVFPIARHKVLQVLVRSFKKK